MQKHLRQCTKRIIERFPRIALTFRYARDGWELFDKPLDTPMGFKLGGNEIMQNGQFEPEETRLVKRLIEDVDVVVNVGANIGYYCCIALSQGKQVVAFEPINLNLRHLLQNIKANSSESLIEVYPVALSNRVGVIEIYGGGTGASLVKGWAGIPESYMTLAPCTTLDNVLGSRLQSKKCFILVDIEGAEQYMLEGAISVAKLDPKPVWMVEVSVCEHQPKGVRTNPNLSSTFHYFWDLGYEAWTADKQCRMVGSVEIEQIVKTGVDTLHTHNFLFIEKGKKKEVFKL